MKTDRTIDKYLKKQDLLFEKTKKYLNNHKVELDEYKHKFNDTDIIDKYKFYLSSNNAASGMLDALISLNKLLVEYNRTFSEFNNSINHLPTVEKIKWSDNKQKRKKLSDVNMFTLSNQIVVTEQSEKIVGFESKAVHIDFAINQIIRVLVGIVLNTTCSVFCAENTRKQKQIIDSELKVLEDILLSIGTKSIPIVGLIVQIIEDLKRILNERKNSIKEFSNHIDEENMKSQYLLEIAKFTNSSLLSQLDEIIKPSVNKKDMESIYNNHKSNLEKLIDIQNSYK